MLAHRVYTLHVLSSVTGTPAYGGSVTNETTAVQRLERIGVMDVSSSTVGIDDIGIAGDSAGDTIKYTIVLANAGTTTLKSIKIFSSQLLEQLERYGHLRFSAAIAAQAFTVRNVRDVSCHLVGLGVSTVVHVTANPHKPPFTHSSRGQTTDTFHYRAVQSVPAAVSYV